MGQMSSAASREGLTDGSRHATRGWSASRAMRLAGPWRSTWLAGSARGAGDPTLHSSIIAASLSVHPSMAPPPYSASAWVIGILDKVREMVRDGLKVLSGRYGWMLDRTIALLSCVPCAVCVLCASLWLFVC